MFELPWWTAVLFAVAVVAAGYIIGILIRAVGELGRASKHEAEPPQ